MALLDLLHVQRANFSNFLKWGIHQELSQINLTSENTRLQVIPFCSKSPRAHVSIPSYASLIAPGCTPREAILYQKSWSCKLVARVRFTVVKRISQSRPEKDTSFPFQAPEPCFPLISPSFYFVNDCLVDGKARNPVVRTPGLLHQRSTAVSPVAYPYPYPLYKTGVQGKKLCFAGEASQVKWHKVPVLKILNLEHGSFSSSSFFLNTLCSFSMVPPSRLFLMKPRRKNTHTKAWGYFVSKECAPYPERPGRGVGTGSRSPSLGQNGSNWCNEGPSPGVAPKRRSYSCFLASRSQCGSSFTQLSRGYAPEKQGSFNTVGHLTPPSRSSEFFIVVGELPLMTRRGHFVINGSPRVVLSQLVRAPGMYFAKRNNELQIDCIPEQGPWLCIYKESTQFYCYTKQFSSIPFTFFYSSFRSFELHAHFTDQTLLLTKLKTLEKVRQLREGVTLLLQFVVKNRARKKLKTFYTRRCLTATQQFEKRKLLWRLRNKMVLGPLGRANLNRKLGLSVCQTHLLTSFDLGLMVQALASTNKLTKLTKKLDDIDDLSNQRVITSSDQLKQQLHVGCLRFKKMFLKLVRESWNMSQTMPDLFNGALREFFGSNPLSQFLDQTNPLAELTHKRRISKLGLGGIHRESATLKVRTIHPTYFGRICPIETPEGLNAGLVNSLTCLSRVSSQKQLVTPLSPLQQNQVQNQFFCYSRREESALATTDTNLLPFQRLPKEFVGVKNESHFQLLEPKAIPFRVQSDLQTISLATALIPFLAYDDANRALMGSNMQRQAVPLLLPERPFVRIGLEGLVIGESGQVLQAVRAGFVSYVSAQRLVLVCCLVNRFNLNERNHVPQG